MVIIMLIRIKKMQFIVGCCMILQIVFSSIWIPFHFHIICWSYLNFVINENIFVVLFFLFNLAYNDKKGGGNMIGELNIYSC